MNWYKKSQEIIEKSKDKTYLDIGHGRSFRNRSFKKPNQIWIYSNGQVLTVEEEENTTHNAFDYQSNILASYSGRYEPDTGRLSIVPSDKANFNRIPESVLLALKQKFRYIEKVYIF